MTDQSFTPGLDVGATAGSHVWSTGAATQDHGPGAPGQPQDPFGELGFPGVLSFGGYIQQAYQRELYWPTVYPLYNRLRRSDPAVTVVRQIFSAAAGGMRFEWKGPENPTSDDGKALEFAESALEDLEGGIEGFRDTLVSHVPFMGWGWWELLPGLRRQGWAAPMKDGSLAEPWHSQFDDGLIGFRQLAFRDHSSFMAWDIDPATGWLKGMKQMAMPHPEATIPLNRSVHVTFGDTANPEGLTPLESLWRLERIGYGYEIVQGIGFEHAAGYLNVQKDLEGEITATDSANIRKAARAILTAQEGNYAAWPFGFTGKVVDVPFTAAGSLQESIRYNTLLKLALYNAQWVGMSSLSDRGSYSALHDASSTWMVFFNAMMSGFASQLDQQFGKRLFDYNRSAFPSMTERPHLTVTPVEKFIELEKLAPFVRDVLSTMPIGDEDYLAIRRKSGFLPEVLPPKPGAKTAADTAPAADTKTVAEAEQEAIASIDDPAVSGFSQSGADAGNDAIRKFIQARKLKVGDVRADLRPYVADARAVSGIGGRPD